ncbi:MAG: hypothetical protein KatS3mg121_1524 [Gammaproteobacteria bacterium]|nr:MAG: hypothetical protein KatS3mg121_1524 [Gammaproteobacteria bacterium]
MKRALLYLGLGLVTLLLFLAVTAPARLVARTLAEHTPLRLEGVQGSLWNGRAQRLSAEGRPLAENLSWRVFPTAVLRGRLELRLELAGGPTAPRGRLDARLLTGGVLRLEDVALEAPADWAARLAALPFGLGGRLHIELDELELRPDRRPGRARGRIDWRDAAVLSPAPQPLGAYRIELQHEPADDPQRVVGTLRDLEGPLHAQGTLTHQPDGSLAVDLLLDGRRAPPAVRDVLPLLGRVQDDGRVRLQRRLQPVTGR